MLQVKDLREGHIIAVPTAVGYDTAGRPHYRVVIYDKEMRLVSKPFSWVFNCDTIFNREGKPYTFQMCVDYALAKSSGDCITGIARDPDWSVVGKIKIGIDYPVPRRQDFPFSNRADWQYPSKSAQPWTYFVRSQPNFIQRLWKKVVDKFTSMR